MRTLLDVGLDLALGLALVVALVTLTDEAGGGRVELGRTRLSTLSPATRQVMEGLVDRVLVTYYVSAAETMPSHMRRVEREVTDLLEALRAANPERFDFQIVDPDRDEQLVDFAARRQVAPLRVRHVTRDSYTEQEVWSTLTITYGPSAPARIDGVGPEHLPRLQALIVAQLEQLRAPRPPVFGVAAGPGFERLRELLAERGTVRDVDLAAGGPLPDDLDLLFWLDPGPVTPAVLDAVDRFLESGRHAVVAGSRLSGEVVGPPGEERLRLTRDRFDAEALWGRFGLRPVDGLVLDERHRALEREGAPTLPAPHRITSLANHQDFQQLAFEVNGSLLFELPTPLAEDAEVLSRRGYRAEVLATSSDRTWIRALEDELPVGELPDRVGRSVPKQALAVWLRPAEAWVGSLVALAASTPFTDAGLDMGGVAHGRLLDVLLATLAAPDQLVVHRAGVVRPAPLPVLPAGARAGWRLACILALPLVLAVLAWLRRGRGAGGSRRGTGPAWGPLAWRGLAGLAAVGVLVRLPLPRADLTAEQLNTLHPETARLAAELGGLRARLVFSEPGQLPPALRPGLARLQDLLSDLERAGLDLRRERLRPDELDEDGRAELAALGVTSHQVTSLDEEVTTVRTVWASAVLEAAGRREVLDLSGPGDAEGLEFRLAFALWRLSSGRRPHIAFASDNPRLTAAEAHQHFQTQGLIAPLGKDTYALARELLERAGFQVTHVDPRAPDMPADVDLLVWLQPRRPVTTMMGLLADHLYRGGRALLAVQHFNMQTRQFPGRGFDFVHWPQPQSPDVEEFYLPELGLELVRQVLMDTLNLPIADESQVNASERRDFRPMRNSLPFVVRAVGAHFDPDSPITRGLGDQPFIWASPIRLDEQRLAELGLRATTLISTSPRTWLYDWSGGYLPPEDLPDLLEGPAPGPDGEPAWAGPLPLAVDVRGQFPWPAQAFERPPRGPDGAPVGELPPYPQPEPTDQAAPGRLVLLGASEPFKSERLVELRPDYRADHLLLNAVASLALPEALAEVATRRPVSRGFGLLEPERKLAWRAAVVLAVPVVYLLAAGLLGLVRRRR